MLTILDDPLRIVKQTNMTENEAYLPWPCTGERSLLDNAGPRQTIHGCCCNRKIHYIALKTLSEARSLSGRMPDSQSSEPGFESPFATVSNIGHFRSLHDASVHSAV